MRMLAQDMAFHLHLLVNGSGPQPVKRCARPGPYQRQPRDGVQAAEPKRRRVSPTTWPSGFSSTVASPPRQQPRRAAEERVEWVLQVVELGEFEIRQALDECAEGDFGFKPRQLGAEAEVDAAT